MFDFFVFFVNPFDKWLAYLIFTLTSIFISLSLILYSSKMKTKIDWSIRALSISGIIKLILAMVFLGVLPNVSYKAGPNLGAILIASLFLGSAIHTLREIVQKVQKK